MRLFRFLFAIRTLLKERNIQAIEEEILAQLNGVEVIGDDTLLRLILEIFKNTQRTNYFLDNALITLKIHTNKINYPFAVSTDTNRITFGIFGQGRGLGFGGI